MSTVVTNNPLSIQSTSRHLMHSTAMAQRRYVNNRRPQEGVEAVLIMDKAKVTARKVTPYSQMDIILVGRTENQCIILDLDPKFMFASYTFWELESLLLTFISLQ